MENGENGMFGKRKKSEKNGKKDKKSVDNGGGFVVIYSSAQGTGHERGPGEGRERILKTIQREWKKRQLILK